MVKKIRVIDEEVDPVELDKKDFEQKLLNYLQAIDWKLWELLKLEQAKAGNTAAQAKPKKTKADVDNEQQDFKQIRIDDES